MNKRSSQRTPVLVSSVVSHEAETAGYASTARVNEGTHCSSTLLEAAAQHQVVCLYSPSANSLLVNSSTLGDIGQEMRNTLLLCSWKTLRLQTKKVLLG